MLSKNFASRETLPETASPRWLTPREPFALKYTSPVELWLGDTRLALARVEDAPGRGTLRGAKSGFVQPPERAPRGVRRTA